MRLLVFQGFKTAWFYLHRQGVRLYFNRSGNGWSEAQTLKTFPPLDNLASVQVFDLLGNGTACLVWSSPLPANGRRSLRYVNLMGRQKPHLLIGAANHLGAETRIQYVPSTHFYCHDKAQGKPWITRLAFPVHVVAQVDTLDHISRNRFTTRYAYHHGHYDGEEREFRGFGMVEQWDSAAMASLTGDIPPASATNQDAASHVPPVLTRTWYHTGAFKGLQRISRLYAKDYFGAPADPTLLEAWMENTILPDTLLPDTYLTPSEMREACRALKGFMLRQEVYALDGSEKAHIPYTVLEQNLTLRLLQPRANNRHSVFFSHPRETVTHHHERNADDPRIQHALTLEVDDTGNVTRQLAVGYGRQGGDDSLSAQGLSAQDRLAQTRPRITYTENTLTRAVDTPRHHRTPLPASSRTYEITTLGPKPGRRFTFDQWTANHFALLESALEIPYENAAPSPTAATTHKRLIEALRTHYRPDDLRQTGGHATLLPLGEAQPKAIPGESYRMAFTPGLLAAVYQREGQALMTDPAAVLAGKGPEGGGYVDLDQNGCWWVPSGHTYLAPAGENEKDYAQRHFYLPCRYRDPFGQDTKVTWDAYDVLVKETKDPLENRVTVEKNDYRVLQAQVISDPNRNRTAVAFDALGMVVGSAVMGKAAPAPQEGDSLEDFQANLPPATLDALFNGDAPHSLAPSLLQQATTRMVYDLHRFEKSQEAHPDQPDRWQPVGVATLSRETHESDLAPGEKTAIQHSFSYSDGFGREIQKKIQAEPEKVNGLPAAPRWVASGWTVFNNKGKAVRQYEPFFCDNHHFEFGVQVGVSPILFYDPLDRVIATLYPDNTYEKVVFDPWKQVTYDRNDSCAPHGNETGDPGTDKDIQGYVKGYFDTQGKDWKTWYQQRVNGALGEAEKQAALKAAAHADTPSTVHFDTLGRPFLTVAKNRVTCPGHRLDGTEETLTTRTLLDIEGNQREVQDALGRIVMRYHYDMLSQQIHLHSMEAGERWLLQDVTGKPLHKWDSRGHQFTLAYDALRRPLSQTLRGTTPTSDPRAFNKDIMIEKTVYGESIINAENLNVRGKLYEQSDQAGVITHAQLDSQNNPLKAYDFKGNSLCNTRQLVVEYKTLIDWANHPSLEAETFASATRYDALNRPTQIIAPHSNGPNVKLNVIQHVFNEANLLDRVDVWLSRETEPAALLKPSSDTPSNVGVSNIDYNAKGQRTRIDYKNGTSTLYDYNPDIFRLKQLLTQRNALLFPGDNPKPPPLGWPGAQIQNLHYTYDPAGNITNIQDDAQQTIFFKNKRIEPSNDYVYDALYRLIQADGRERLSQGGAPLPHSFNDAGRVNLLSADSAGRFSPNDGNALGHYLERYVYDGVGNFLQMQHKGSDAAQPGWTRDYIYLEPSLIEDGKSGTTLKPSNRLTRTTLNNSGGQAALESYQHDSHGNMIHMPHLGEGKISQNLYWNYNDQTYQADLGGGGMAFYTYDAAGQRVRKVWEKSTGLREERLYLGGFEIYRKYQGSDTLERETLHILDDKQRIAMIEKRTLDTAGNDKASQQTIRYQLSNHLGSSSLELDDQSQIISYEEYSPYDSTTYQAVRSQTEAPKRYRYTGMERDEESGLEYHSARYYAPWLGRWTSADPLGLSRYREADLNLYAYARGRVINAVDPTGFKEEILNQTNSHGGQEVVNNPVARRLILDPMYSELQVDNSLNEIKNHSVLDSSSKKWKNYGKIALNLPFALVTKGTRTIWNSFVAHADYAGSEAGKAIWDQDVKGKEALKASLEAGAALSLSFIEGYLMVSPMKDALAETMVDNNINSSLKNH